ncbi:Leucine aminopeptidase 2 [Gossypium arboreum]|uniref:Leucine aminopeptidase 2 n=1 Tax=Gossypium arboreum TaxID=29729 RepID=A0A0B0N3L4_GOSAR|nr:Leucine aminopeptidase 2 [Gossypium arboreum]
MPMPYPRYDLTWDHRLKPIAQLWSYTMSHVDANSMSQTRSYMGYHNDANAMSQAWSYMGSHITLMS